MNSLTPSETRLNLARRDLLAPHDLDENVLRSALEIAAASGCSFADLYFEHTAEEGWSLEDQKVSGGSYAIRQGVGVRTLSGDQSALAYTSDLSPRALRQTAQSAREMLCAGNTPAPAQKIMPLRSQGSWQDLYPADEVLSERSIAEKIALLQSVDQRARAIDPRIQRVSARLRLRDSMVLVAASDGTLAADIRPLLQLNLSVIAEGGGRRARGGAGLGGRLGFESLGDVALDRLLQRATSTALGNLEARPAPAGTMTVVLGPGFPGVLLHEAVGHGLEADAHRTGASVFTGMMGQQVAARGVTVVDDGTCPGHPGALNIDDEGTPGAHTVLIENGRLTGLMQDRMHAGLSGAGLTGNARRQSYAHVPMPRMTNTFMIAGEADPQDIIASVRHGIYATEFGGGTVDITSGRFSFSATQAWLIENGRVCAPVSGATLIGVGHEVLKQISMIGNDLALDQGEAVCGKQGQNVLVGVGQPTIRIDEMVVGGSA